MSKQIATFLHRENPEEYTGYCFRGTSATTLVNAGVDITTLKRHGSWKFSQVAERFIENFLQNQVNLANQFVFSLTGSNSSVASHSLNFQFFLLHEAKSASTN